jgi:hypothetical protein
MSDSQRRPGTRRNISIIVIIAIICIIISSWYWLDHTIFKPNRIAEHIDRNINSLYTKCPLNMNKDEWETAVVWTELLLANSLLKNAKMNDLSNFQCQLEERINEKVDMILILWIWNEIAKLTPIGLWYKQKFQKVMLDDMQQASKGTPRIQWFSPGEKKIRY